MKENLEKQIKITEEKIQNYENTTNKNVHSNFNQPTLRPSEFQKNIKPTINKYPNNQNKENMIPEDFSKKNNNGLLNDKNFVNHCSKELFSYNNKIAEIQKDYIKNIYDEKYKINQENEKKRKMEGFNDHCLGKNNSKIDFQKSFGFKQMKFM